jgi:hypothetical protein
MHTVSDILSNIDAGILAQNMMENMFSYRIIFFVNEESNGTKHYIDTTYGNLRKSLENIIREHLSVTNSVVIAAVTVRKNGESVSLLGRSYAFSLDGYFQKICEEKVENTNSSYGRRMAQWC